MYAVNANAIGSARRCSERNVGPLAVRLVRRSDNLLEFFSSPTADDVIVKEKGPILVCREQRTSTSSFLANLPSPSRR